ncbi:MAG: GntR family transcriptional regulator [Mongoliibacter sp.]|uniref:GntR family transcriptional regulator n=1 Tax=Mongoliibacter sp. TaxID=2022438 RepID=UPI0012F0FC15|nr:GntR family transcriptional regulator [Mongoliibacter sp.]TVP47682.1 MAG: GntR family transcriptional regulator [Mongoliibacter sp.]
MKPDLNIDDSSSIPKYIQVVKAIKGLVTSEVLCFGDKIPSINNLSAEHSLSRDTVEKAYTILKKQGIIESVRGKGYYISHHSDLSKYNVLLIFNKLSAYKKEIFNSFVIALEDRAEISFQVHHCEYDLLKKILEKQKETFDYYVVMPHFKKDQEQKAYSLLESIPNEKLIFLDNKPDDIPCFGAVFQDFKSDIYGALKSLTSKLKKYNKLILVFPFHSSYPYPENILLGFKKFAVEEQFGFGVMSEFNLDHTPIEGEVYIVIEETDLVNLIKKAREMKGLIIGENLGILSYNETPLKEVLQKGITVISTDFAKMGKLTADMILSKEGKMIKNEFSVIKRESL